MNAMLDAMRNALRHAVLDAMRAMQCICNASTGCTQRNATQLTQRHPPPWGVMVTLVNAREKTAKFHHKGENR